MQEDLFDLDHVVLSNGKIYRVLGNSLHSDTFVGYNVYLPDNTGDREYAGKRYKKRFIEDELLPLDVRETYELLNKSDIQERVEPIVAALRNGYTFQKSIWGMLYQELVQLCGQENIGVFGSSMFNLHLKPDGSIRKDIDFVIDGLRFVEKLSHMLPEIRERLGFQEVSSSRQLKQYERYQRVFQNKNNSILSIIKRRWTGLQLTDDIVSTLRFRDRNFSMPLDLQAPTLQKNHILCGQVMNASLSNLFPRAFDILNEEGVHRVQILWWKFSTPVRDGDRIQVCGDVVRSEDTFLQLTNFRNHWLRFPSDEVNE